MSVETVERTAAPRLRAGNLANRYGLLVAWALLIVVFGVLEPDTFLTTSNFQNIFSSQAVLLILTLGLLPSLAVGAYDLSAAGTMGLSLVLVGWLNVVHEWPILPSIAVALAAGVLVGAVNAGVIVALGIDSIVATLGMGTFLIGVALGINSLSVSGVSEVLVDAVRTEVFGLQLAFFYALGFTALIWYVFSFTPLGRYLFFVGAGGDVARLSGIPVNRIRAGSLVFTGFIAALSGVVLAGTLGGADPTSGPAFLLPAFAGAFLGATAITPGRFNPWGTFIGVYFLVTGITGLQLLGLSGYIEQVFFGGSLVLAVAVPRLIAMRRGGER
jgi:ribose transport system permease protein